MYVSNNAYLKLEKYCFSPEKYVKPLFIFADKCEQHKGFNLLRRQQSFHHNLGSMAFHSLDA